MKSRDVILTFVTAVVIAGTNFFVSCSSQQPKQTSEEEDLMALSVAEVSDQHSDGVAKDPLLGDPTTAKAETTPSTQSSESLGALEGVPDDVNGAPAESSLPPIAESADSSPSPEFATPRENSHLAPEHTTALSPTYSGGTYIAAVPVIPAKAITRGGVSLNRFYFVRAGDTRTSVAEMLYGDKNRAKDLANWNPGFRPGKALYYQSASNPNDDQMRSFYQERNVPGEEYAVRSGDWLSKIAQRRFRSPWSWTEIAVTNGIDRPERIARGTKIALYPKDLSSFRADGAAPAVAQNTNEAPTRAGRGGRVKPTPEPTEPPQVAQNEPPPGLPPTDLGNDVPPPPPQNAVAANGDTVAIPQPGSVESFTKDEKAGGSLNLMRIIEQNLFMGAVGALSIILLLVLLAVSRKRKAMEAIEDEPVPAGLRGKR